MTRCESTQLYIFDGRQRSNDTFGHANSALTYLCVYHQDVAFNEEWVPVEPALVEQGCNDEPQLTVVDTLDSITADVPALELTAMLCTYDPETGEEECTPGQTRSVAVEALITGTGDVAPSRSISKSRSVFDGYRCSFLSASSGVSREGAASMTFDGSALGETFAQLTEGKTRFAQHCS